MIFTFLLLILSPSGEVAMHLDYSTQGVACSSRERWRKKGFNTALAGLGWANGKLSVSKVFCEPAAMAPAQKAP